MAAPTLWGWYMQQRAVIRAEFEQYRTALYVAADADCKGVLLNQLGLKRGIDPESLFEGPWSRVEKYASEELHQWFLEHPRQTYGEFESYYVEGMTP